MADLGSPLDDVTIDLKIVERNMVKIFSRNGVIDAEEQRVLDNLRRATDTVSGFQARTRAVASWVKTGVVNAYTRRQFGAAGATIEALPGRPSNIIDFPIPHEPLSAA